MKWPGIICCFYWITFTAPAKGNWPGAKTLNPVDTLLWIADFKMLRTAIYQHDIRAVKKHFNFPVLNPNNEIWYLVLQDAELSKPKFSGAKIVPFNEKDLALHFNKIFTRPFIKSILKIKTNELFKNGYAETPVQSDDSTTSYRMYATYEKKSGLLTLNLAYNQITKDDEGNISDGGESNVIYFFLVQKNGRLLFKEIRLAG